MHPQFALTQNFHVKSPGTSKSAIVLIKLHATSAFPRKQKGKCRATFFGTVVEVQCNFRGEPMKTIVERDNGETET